MAFRFRKTLSLGKGLKLNIGKGTVGLSAGVKGAHIGLGSRGAYTSAGIPGTGLSTMSYLKKGGKNTDSSNTNTGTATKGCAIIVGIILWLYLVSEYPSFGIFMFMFVGVCYLVWRTGSDQQAKAKLKKARKFFNEENYAEAVKLLEEAADLDKENRDVIYFLGASLHNAGEYKKAMPHLKALLEHDSQNFDVQLLLANCYYQTQNYADAINLLQKIPLDDEEPDLKAIQLLGACFYSQKQYDLAISVFRKAPLQKRNLNEDLLEVHYNLGLIYEKSGDKENAQKHFKRVYAHDVGYRDVKEKIEKTFVQK